MMLVDKENGKSFVQMEETSSKHNCASKSVANTALGLGIGATALWLLGGGFNRFNLFGNGVDTTTRNEQYIERKECEDVVALSNAIWKQSFDAQAARFADRQVINQEMFGIYSTMRNGFDAINSKHNQDAFDLYKYSRDNKDELSAEIGNFKTELAVLKATRPYQDKLIQCSIDNVAQQANFNLWQRTCRMISGEVVLPNTPTVTGFGSYNPCACAQQSSASIQSKA